MGHEWGAQSRMCEVSATFMVMTVIQFSTHIFFAEVPELLTITQCLDTHSCPPSFCQGWRNISFHLTKAISVTEICSQAWYWRTCVCEHACIYIRCKRLNCHSISLQSRSRSPHFFQFKTTPEDLTGCARSHTGTDESNVNSRRHQTLDKNFLRSKQRVSLHRESEARMKLSRSPTSESSRRGYSSPCAVIP